MGIEARYSVSIIKVCDGCGERWESHQSFSHVAAVLAFGGPVEASTWEFHTSEQGVHLLCDLCAEHTKATA